MIYKNKSCFLLVVMVVFISIIFVSLDLQAQVENRFAFKRDLTLGSTGFDVRELQVFLNRDLDTKLAVSGVGSSGQETQYFGPITKNALIRFQEKYASEILTPFGLSRGTGYFGPSTRNKIDSILSKEEPVFDQTEKVENEETEQKQESKESFSQEEIKSSLEKSDVLSLKGEMYTDELMLTQLSNYSGQKGEKLKLYGFGFTDSNTVYFGDRVELKNIKAESHDTIEIDVPESLELGYHEIQIENEKGRTTDSRVFFVVTNESSVEPKIDRVYPDGVSFGEEITIYGEGFDRDWNMIRASFEIIEGVVSDDGKSLTFKVESFYEKIDTENQDFLTETDEEMEKFLEEMSLEGFEESTDSWEEEVYFYVINDGGISKTPGKFLLKH